MGAHHREGPVLSALPLLMHTGKHKTTQRNRILVKQGCVKYSLPGLLRLGDCTKETACQ